MSMLANLFVVVSVFLAVFPVNMSMLMNMGVFVSVGHAIVQMGMCVSMLVQMGVL